MTGQAATILALKLSRVEKVMYSFKPFLVVMPYILSLDKVEILFETTKKGNRD